RRPGDSAGCPRCGNKCSKSPSVYTISSASRRVKYGFPFGKAARATRAVSSGTCDPGCGDRDIALAPHTRVMKMALILPGFPEKGNSPTVSLSAELPRGADVVILPDNDEPGRKHAKQVAQALYGIAASIKVVELPGLPPKGDVTDWIWDGGTREQL